MRRLLIIMMATAIVSSIPLLLYWISGGDFSRGMKLLFASIFSSFFFIAGFACALIDYLDKDE